MKKQRNGKSMQKYEKYRGQTLKARSIGKGEEITKTNKIREFYETS